MRFRQGIQNSGVRHFHFKTVDFRPGLQRAGVTRGDDVFLFEFLWNKSLFERHEPVVRPLVGKA